MMYPAFAAELHENLHDYVAERVAEFDQIPAERRLVLDKLAIFIQKQRDADATVRLTFICTHNSRRSHMAQIWAAVAAAHYGITDVETFSGGTARTAFNPRAIAALKQAGFDIRGGIPGGENPQYQVRYSAEGPAIESFSKVYSEDPNPERDFCAIMTCSQADEACPNVAGALERMALPYEDPKVADDTPDESAVYAERCAQIAREMLYVFSRVHE
jgi:arsenate reductase